MIEVFPSSSRHRADLGWLTSNLSFSFADYYDPKTVAFGPMRVLNDDFVVSGSGFGMHPHRNMEIVSIVLEGELQHQDSTGHTAVTTFGGVQRMTAGTGIIHSEMNPGEDTVNFLQLWFDPEENNLTPSYQTTQYDPSLMKNTLLPVVSKNSSTNVSHIHQDLTIYLSDLEAGEALNFEQAEGRRTFVFIIEGSLRLNEIELLNKRDSARITSTSSLQLIAADHTRFMLVDLP
ncbi:pirin family protein [Paenibacillus rigui]|uniref:Pirin family protein n=1 Tax=Paenibacillus rigui TaxID=554312 RepID=A0A229UK81_9BACL|nr:pirin family protein [Paenibacillus rigui]OXM83715.1 pirin family protein [Paenibacillus rigui]